MGIRGMGNSTPFLVLMMICCKTFSSMYNSEFKQAPFPACILY